MERGATPKIIKQILNCRFILGNHQIMKVRMMNYYRAEITVFVEDSFLRLWTVGIQAEMEQRPLSTGPDIADKTCKQSTFKVIISILTIINP